MTLIKGNYLSKLNRIQEVFHEITKEIFTNQCSCEETELHSFFVETSESFTAIYFDGEQLPAEDIPDKETAGYRTLIKRYLYTQWNGRKYLLEDSETYEGDIYRYKMYWVLTSAYLDNYQGTLVLNCFFHQIADSFNQFVKNNQTFVWTENIVEGAEAHIDRYLKGMFAPFKPYMVDSLSGEYYEKSECKSNMVFLPHAAVKKLKTEDFIYHFQEIPFINSNRRLIRKLLQITQDKLYLVLGESIQDKSFKLLGICYEKRLNNKLVDNNGMAIPYLKVNIKKHMQWDLFLNETYILTCKNGHYKIECDLQEKFLYTKFTEYFGEQNGNYRTLIKNVTQSTKQGHGTMLVILEKDMAVKEARRFGDNNYGLAESAPKVHTKEINQLNIIDGSVILDTHGKVHGIGMILDGAADKKGDLARGARYNSAKKYCDFLRKSILDDKQPYKGMILVVSEDGSVDILTV